MSHSLRLLRYTDQFIYATLNDEAGAPLEQAQGTLQVFTDKGVAVTAALTLTESETSPADGIYTAELDSGSPAFSVSAGSSYYAEIIITSPSDARMIRRVHIVDG